MSTTLTKTDNNNNNNNSTLNVGVGVTPASASATSSSSTLKATTPPPPRPTTLTPLTDEPKYSSAALCLQLIHLSKTFQPEYTHQCTLDGLECFYGYQPTKLTTNNAITKFLLQQQQQRQRKTNQYYDNKKATTTADDFILHKSHYQQQQQQQQQKDFIDGSLHDLSIQVELSPSCRKCTVNIEITANNTTNDNTNSTNETDEGKEVDDGQQQQQQQQQPEEDEPVSKKLKIDTTTTASTKENNNDSNKDNINNDDGIRAQQQQPKQEEASSSSSSSTTRRSRMTKSEIQQCISKALPEIVNNNNPVNVHDDFLEQPIGNIIEEFTTIDNKSLNKKRRERTNNDDDDDNNDNDHHQRQRHRQYCLTLADGQDPVVNQYHNQIQKLAIWFIENADDVNVSDINNGGYWKILYLFEKFDGNDDNNNDEKYALVGYMTLFHFRSPFHKPNPGIIIRICQALVLPHYQGYGFGSKMMQCIYDNIVHHRHGHGHGHGRRKTQTTTGDNKLLHSHNQNLNSSSLPSIVLINVEDPAPAFVNLRNKIDLQLMMEYGQQWWPSSSERRNIINDENYFTTISQQDALRVSGLAKITPRQLIIVDEMMKYIALQNYLSSVVVVDDNGNNDNDNKKNINMNKERLITKFRLMVKKRLNKEHGIEISQYATKERKKAYLAELYEQEIQYYQKLLKKFFLPTPTPPSSTSSTT